MQEDKKKKTPNPANWLIAKFIKDGLHEEFFGDLEEIYEDRILTRGQFYANLLYWIDALHLLLGFISFKLFKNQNNPTIMYKHYLQISRRNLMRNKVYSLINILGLAVGMGVCLTLGQYIFFELSYDQFHTNYQNTYRITIDKTQNGGDRVYARTTYGIGPYAKATIPEIKEYVRHAGGSSATVVINPDNNGRDNQKGLLIDLVDITFLEVFNFPLKLGNKQSAFDDKFNIVLTEKAANKYFGNDDPIGKTLIVNEGWLKGNYTVSAVLDELPVNSHLQFEALLSMEILLEDDISSYANSEAWEREHYVTYVTLEESADLDVVHKKLDQIIIQNRGPENADKAVLQPIADIHLRSGDLSGDYSVTNKGNLQDVRVFSIVAIFILFIAWINYINLSTARSLYRSKEVGVRKSIGAFRKQLISQFMVESVLVNAIAAVLSIGLTFVTLPFLENITGRELPFSFLQVPMFWLWFSVVVLLGSLLSGLYPAFVLSAFKPANILGSNKTTRVGKVNLRRGLIVFQFLTSLVLIAGTYLIYKQITFMKDQELGIDMEKILVVSPYPAPGLDSTKRANLIFSLQTFKTEVVRHHSIISVAGSGTVPGKGHTIEDSFRKLGEPVSANQYGRIVNANINFPETYGFEIIAGSSFTPDMEKINGAVIINEEAVRSFGYSSPESAIGETIIRVRDIMDKVRPYRVVGVVKNFNWHSLKDAQTPYLFSFAPHWNHYISLKISLSDVPETLTHIEETYMSLFPGKEFNYFFLEDEFNRQYQSDVQFRNLFFAFTALAIFIACIGLFAMVSFSASMRIKEIGIRKINGASVGNLMLLLSREYITLLLIANALAIPAVLYWGSSWLENFAFRIAIGFDLFIIPVLVLLLVAFLTVSYRTYASAKANPVDSLKLE